MEKLVFVIKNELIFILSRYVWRNKKLMRPCKIYKKHTLMSVKGIYVGRVYCKKLYVLFLKDRKNY